MIKTREKAQFCEWASAWLCLWSGLVSPPPHRTPSERELVCVNVPLPGLWAHSGWWNRWPRESLLTPVLSMTTRRWPRTLVLRCDSTMANYNTNFSPKGDTTGKILYIENVGTFVWLILLIQYWIEEISPQGRLTADFFRFFLSSFFLSTPKGLGFLLVKAETSNSTMHLKLHGSPPHAKGDTCVPRAAQQCDSGAPDPLSRAAWPVCSDIAKDWI